MYHPAESDEYSTTYLSWPDMISPRCDICGTPVKFAHSDNGKLVQTLDEIIHQVVNYYTCPNPKCENHNRYFNPAVRFDFSQKHWGKEILDRIARELFVFEQSPPQIHKRLTLDYHLEISLRSVERICQEILLVKANNVDKTTQKLIHQNDGVVMAMDAQIPGTGVEGIWLFTDVRTNRVLRTILSKSMPADKLHIVIEQILSDYNTSLLGAVHDKQNNIVLCMKTYFPQVPDQYCTYHFVDHLWAHLAMFDGQIYSKLKGIITNLDIHDRPNYKPVKFDQHGSLAVKDVFATIDNDLQKMTHYRTQKFRFLRGLAIFRTLKRYTMEMQIFSNQMDGNSRYDKIFNRTLQALTEGLQATQIAFFEGLYMYDSFKVIYRLLYHEILPKADRQRQLDDIIGCIWAVCRNKDPSLLLENLRTFNPNANSSCSKVLGEWIRLWNSYLPGLFAYYDFPIDIRTNVGQERIFSKEKTALVRRMAKKEVGYVQELQGELYIRLSQCEQAELLHDIVHEYMETEIKVLTSAYQQKVHQITDSWFYKAEPFHGIQESLTKYHPKWMKEKK